MSNTYAVDTDSDHTVDLARYGKAALRGWPIVVVLMILGAAAGIAANLLQPLSYTATSVVQVNAGPIYAIDTTTAAGPNMDTEQQIALSSTVVAATVKKVPGSLAVVDFQALATATTPLKSATLVLTFTGTSPEQAATGANELANAYLAHRTAQVTADITQARKQVSENSKALGTQLAQAQTDAAAARAGTADAARLDDRVKLLNDQLTPIRAQLDRLNSVVINPGVLIGVASPPLKSNNLPEVIFIAVGAMVGLLAALVVILAREALGDRIRSRADLGRISSVPVWAQTQSRDKVLPDAVSSALATRVEVLQQNEPLRSLAVVSLSTSVQAVCEQLAREMNSRGTLTTVAIHPRSIATDDVRLVIVPAGDLSRDQSAAPLAGLCDATLVVVRGSDTAAAVRTALHDLSTAPAHVCGLLLDLRKRPADGSTDGGSPSRSLRKTSSDTKAVDLVMGPAHQ